MNSNDKLMVLWLETKKQLSILYPRLKDEMMKEDVASELVLWVLQNKKLLDYLFNGEELNYIFLRRVIKSILYMMRNRVLDKNSYARVYDISKYVNIDCVEEIELVEKENEEG